MDSKRLTAEALRGIKAAAEGNTTDTPMAFRSMLRSLLADRAALEKRVGELEAEKKTLAIAAVVVDERNRELEAALRPFGAIAKQTAPEEFLITIEASHVLRAAKALADRERG